MKRPVDVRFFCQNLTSKALSFKPDYVPRNGCRCVSVCVCVCLFVYETRQEDLQEVIKLPSCLYLQNFFQYFSTFCMLTGRTNKQTNKHDEANTGRFLKTRKQLLDSQPVQRRRCHSRVWFPARASKTVCCKARRLPWSTSCLELNGRCLPFPGLKRLEREAEKMISICCPG
jgi:hypothetical protein